jgi:putative ABC transport system permease protein
MIARIVELLLLLYPPSLRREHGPEMALAVSEAWRGARGLRARARLVLHLLRDFATSWPGAGRAGHGRSPRQPLASRRPWAPGLSADVRSALRLWSREPLFVLAAVLTLSLGIGMATAIFSLADATLLRPLPIPHVERVLQSRWSWSHPDFRDLEARQTAFSEVAAWTGFDLGLQHDSQTLGVKALGVSGAFFSLTGQRPVAGRLLTEADDQRGAPLVAVLSERVWERVFERRPSVVGETVQINRRPVRIAGILPRAFRGMSLREAPEIFVPLSVLPDLATGLLARPGLTERRNTVWLQVAGRLRDGVTPLQAEDHVDRIYRQVHPPDNMSRPLTRIVLVSAVARAIGLDSSNELRRFVAVLGGATVVTLLLSCATVANLLLIRAERRRRELALRTALGASRVRTLRLLMTESLAIGLAGGLVGIGIATLSTSLLSAFILPGRIAIADLALTVNSTVLLLAIGLGVLTSVVCGCAPLWHASRVTMASMLRTGDRGAAHQPLCTALVIVQLALCVLLAGGGVTFARAVREALSVELGFDTRHTSRVTIDPGLVRYSRTQAVDLRARVLEAFRGAAWVQAAGWSATLPLQGRMQWLMSVEGYVTAPNEVINPDGNVVSDGYFEALGIPPLAGRTFAPSDTEGSERVAVVSERLARRYWPNGSAVGGRVSLDPQSADQLWATVVGIVGDVRRGIERQAEPMLYVPMSQQPNMAEFGGQHLFVRSMLPSDVAARESAALVRQLDALVPISAADTLLDQVKTAAMAHRLGLTLFGLFATLAVVLTAFGVYAVVSYAVAQRTKEIGIRVALGAERTGVLALVVRQGAWPVVLGLTAGVGAFWFTSGLLRQFALSQPVFDGATVAGLAVGVGMLASVAMIVPARRALRVDPASTLRNE